MAAVQQALLGVVKIICSISRAKTLRSSAMKVEGEPVVQTNFSSDAKSIAGYIVRVAERKRSVWQI